MITTKVAIPTYISEKEIKTEGISLVRMIVTPEIAAFWLKTYNLINRPISRQHLNFIVDQMKRGQWLESNGNVISFNTNCLLNDGQHRLAALVKTGKSFKFSIVLGVDPAAFKITDTGRNRGASDVLAIAGYKYANSLASIAKFIMNYKASRFGVAVTAGGEGSYRVTNSDVLSFVNSNKEKMIANTSMATNYTKAGDNLVSVSHTGGLLFLFSEFDYIMAERFCFQLATGSNVDHNSPMYVLRRKLRIAKDSLTSSMDLKTKVFYIIKTWNITRKGKTITQLRIDKGGLNQIKIV